MQVGCVHELCMCMCAYYQAGVCYIRVLHTRHVGYTLITYKLYMKNIFLLIQIKA